MNLEITSHPLIILFIITWLVEFYLFGMQRASLKISRQNEVDWKGLGEQLLPKWYPITWLVRITKYILIVAISIYLSWKLALTLLFLSYILTITLPIPYRFLYKNVFRARVSQIGAIDVNLGQFYNEMLKNTNF
jgi:hypothetical protein